MTAAARSLCHRFLSLALLGLGALTARAEEAATVPPAKLDAPALARAIDQAITQKLVAEKMPASARADDAEFLRRAYLDVTGTIPTAEEAAAFLDNKDADKRAKLIDKLLASPAYGRRMADLWTTLLVQRTSENRNLSFDPLAKWLEERFNQNQKWDALVTDVLTATGEQTKNPAVTFWLAQQTVDKFTDQVSKLFLGVQLQCAQCHNHPFTSWKQTEYWGMATFFMRVRPDNARKKGENTLGVTEMAGKGRQRLPESAKVVPAKFLGGDQPKLSDSAPARPVLAKWLTAADNKWFAKAMVNRLWAQYFGRGFVNPVDNMHDGNIATHPELLKDLASQFTTSGFDVKYLIRSICQSDAYQRTSRTLSDNEDDVALFSHMTMKPLTPEQLFDSLTQVCGKAPEADRRAARANAAGQRGAPANRRTAFVAFFNIDEGADLTEYNAGIPQVLRLMNSNEFHKGGAAASTYVKSGDKPAANLERLYLATVSRRPTADEVARLTTYVEKNPKTGYGDVLWALLNSSEFAMIR